MKQPEPGHRPMRPIGSVHILLVEDNEDQRELTIEALSTGIPDTRITVAKDGPCALETVTGNRPDLVLLDYNLPGMTGLEILREIVKHDAKIPVIMVTGQGDERIAVETMKNGAHDYIIKTRNYHETLPITVERAIRESRMKRELEEASLRGRRLYELSLSVAKERKVDILSERLVSGAATLIGTEKALLYLVDPCGSVAFVKTHGTDIDPRQFMGPLDDIGVLSGAYREARLTVVEDPRSHPHW
ncbi:MAG TPA: response regulator, partial [Pseudodesulfovibrio sp.]|nr:response regulator [Pseudodesulfovibrio sp.]